MPFSFSFGNIFQNYLLIRLLFACDKRYTPPSFTYSAGEGARPTRRIFMADERARAIDLAFAQIEKQFGKGSIMRLGSKEAIVPISVISTGAISFDSALGVGGFPRGRVVEIFGPESSGKTTIALQVIASAQAQGGMAAL